jgi:hypothetical protein
MIWLLAVVLACTPGEVDAIAARLVGQQFTIAPDRSSITIDDIAGEGAPRIGVVARDGRALVLDTDEGRFVLAGPLARPRLAGPGYTIWVIGDVQPGSVPTLTIHRLGVLRRPNFPAAPRVQPP